MQWCLCVLRTLLLVALYVDRGWEASFLAHGHLEFIMLVQQQSEPLVDLLSGANQFFFVLMDAAVLACTFPRPSFVVKCNQLYSEMTNVRACFCDVATRVLCFGTARQLSTDLEGLETSCRQEDSQSHFCVFLSSQLSV